MSDQLTNNPLVDAFDGQARNERVTKNVPPSQILPLAVCEWILEAMVQSFSLNAVAGLGRLGVLPKQVDYHECDGKKSKNAENQFVWLQFVHAMLLCETDITETRLC